MFRPMKPYQIATDVFVAVACVFVEYVVVGFGFSTIALVGMATALALRRLSPDIALGLVWIFSLIQVFFNIGPDISNLAIFPVLYATASYGRPLVKWAGLVSSFAGAFVMTGYFWWRPFFEGVDFYNSAFNIVTSIPQFVITFFVVSAAFALSWTLGLLAKTWRTSRESNHARILAEYARVDAEKSVIVEQERNRIARDMHDVVAHSLAVVIAQADGARYARQSDPSAVDEALTTISTTAREALGDVRILLGQLRHAQSDAPQPVLADLDRLYEQMRSAGLLLKVQVSGAPAQLMGGVQLAVYRIVQEALTNALRHGALSGDTTVAFAWHEEVLSINISNPVDARGASEEAKTVAHGEGAPTEPSHGLAGMSERALLVGGSLATAHVDAQFTVAVTIPLHSSEEPV